jgi:hypothetical protein
MISVLGDTSTSGLVESALGSLTCLRSLNLAGNEFGLLDLTTSGPSLTGLTYLSMVCTDMRDWHLARMTPFLPSLTNLDLQGCKNVTLRPSNHLPPYFLASLTALTRLDLSRTKNDDAGMEALTPLTALTQLHLDFTAMSGRGLNLLAPLAAHLTHLTLGAEGEYGDPYMIAVSSFDCA